MISLIIPTLNEEKYIRKTLQCLQEFRKNKIIEIIIVDGLSQDNTLALSRDLCDKVISVKPGRADQLNAGALKANNNLLLFIHADTIVNPENIYELLRKYEKIEWGYFHLGFRTRAFKFKLLSYCINLRSTLFKYATGDQCLFVKKKLFKKVNGYSSLRLMEDVELSNKLLEITQPTMMKSIVYTSARKWINDGYIKTILKMRVLRFLYFLGLDTKYLEKMYK